MKGKQAFVLRISASRDGLVLVKGLEESVTSSSRILEAQGSDGEVERVQVGDRTLL